MLIKEDEVSKRLNNPLNLMNRMRDGIRIEKRQRAMDLFVRKEENREVSKVVVETNLPQTIPPAPANSESSPKVDNLVDDADAKIQLTLAHNDALSLLTNSIGELNRKVISGDVPAKSIPAIITAASRVVTDIRKERIEREKNKGNENTHYHFYVPAQRKIEEYEVIEVTG